VNRSRQTENLKVLKRETPGFSPGSSHRLDKDKLSGAFSWNSSGGGDGNKLLKCPSGEYLAGIHIHKSSDGSGVDYVTNQIYCRPFFIDDE
jgi:hypothetical protein